MGNVKKEDIVSNLSQDGVMVITMPKEQRIEEVERGSTPIQVDHVRSSAERKTEEVSSREKSEDILNQGRVDNFDGPGEMQRRRRSLSKAGRSRDTSRARETSTTTADTGKENRESKTTSARGSSRGLLQASEGEF